MRPTWFLVTWVEPGGSEVPAISFPCTRCVHDACLPGAGGDLNGVLVAITSISSYKFNGRLFLTPSFFF